MRSEWREMKTATLIQAWKYWRGRNAPPPIAHLSWAKNKEEVEQFVRGQSICPWCWNIGVGSGGGYDNVLCLCKIPALEKQWADEIKNAGLLPPPGLANARVNQINPSWDNSPQSNMTDVVKTVVEWVKSYDPRWVLFRGTEGTAKTHLAAAMLNATYGGVWAFLSASQFSSLASEMMERGELAKWLSVLKNVPALLIDDIGTEYGTAFIAAKLHEVVEARYLDWQSKMTVATTNLPLSEQAFAEMPISARRLFDRLKDKSFLYITPKQKSYRRS